MLGFKGSRYEFRGIIQFKAKPDVNPLSVLPANYLQLLGPPAQMSDARGKTQFRNNKMLNSTTSFIHTGAGLGCRVL